MKKALSMIMVLAILATAGFAGTAQAGTSDTFDITITVNYLEMSLKDRAGLDYSAWAIGQVSTSSANVMASNAGAEGDEGIMVDNGSNVAVDVECYVSNTGGTWVLGGAIGDDQFKVEAKSFDAWQAGTAPDMTDAVTITQTGSPGNDLAASVPVNTDKYLYYRFTAPVTTTSGAEQTIQMSVEVSAS